MHLLIVEDDTTLCVFLEEILQRDGYRTTIKTTGTAALEALHNDSFDALILDRMLPEMDGLQVLKQLRREGLTLPVLLLTALGTPNDKVEGLDAGADDYLAKPFDAEELCARLRALIRSRNGKYTTSLRFGDVTLDNNTRILVGPKGQCELSGREADLLDFFLKNPNRVLPRALILERIWGTESEVEEGNLNNYVFFVRRRLRQVESKVEIQTIRGLGYRVCQC